MTIISVGRNGQEIGDYYLEGIQEGLASGYFLPSDFGWYDGLTEWLPLNDLVATLNAPPLLPPPLPPLPLRQPASPIPTPLPPLPIATPRKQKQNLKPKKDEVTYVLKESKPKRGKAKPSVIHAWRNDPATEKQITFLHGLGARGLPNTLTKGAAHDKIDALLASGNAYNFLTPKQLACLHYYGFDVSKIDYEEAKTLLDRVHESPESFDVPEPWETAKYRLYPKLYPAASRGRPRGCLIFVLVAVICVGAIIYISLH